MNMIPVNFECEKHLKTISIVEKNEMCEYLENKKKGQKKRDVENVWKMFFISLLQSFLIEKPIIDIY